MAATPKLKVYNAHGEYVAAFKHAEDAAAFVAMAGPGVTIRDGYGKKDTVWHEGKEAQSAAESFDFVAKVVADRIAARVTVRATFAQMNRDYAKGAK